MTEHNIEIPCNTEVVIKVSCTERTCGTATPVICDGVFPILIVEPVIEPGIEPIADPIIDFPILIVEPVIEPVVELTPDPVIGSPKPIDEPVAVIEQITEPVVIAEPVIEPIAEPVADLILVAEPVIEAPTNPVIPDPVIVEPIQTLNPDPVIVAEPAPSPVVDPVVTPTPSQVPIIEPPLVIDVPQLPQLPTEPRNCELASNLTLAEFGKQLIAAAKGLLYPSESDFAIEVLLKGFTSRAPNVPGVQFRNLDRVIPSFLRTVDEDDQQTGNVERAALAERWRSLYNLIRANASSTAWHYKVKGRKYTHEMIVLLVHPQGTLALRIKLVET
jgi:hypothetical protein